MKRTLNESKGGEYERILSIPRATKSPTKTKRLMPPLHHPSRSKNNSIFNTPMPKSLKDLENLNTISAPAALGTIGQSRFHTRHKSVNAVNQLLPKSKRHIGALSPMDPHKHLMHTLADSVDSENLGSNATTIAQDYVQGQDDEQRQWERDKQRKAKYRHLKEGARKSLADDAINK